MRNGWQTIVLIGAMVVWAATGYALINPNFTPNDLIAQSDQIVVLKLALADTADAVRMEPIETLKGSKAAGDMLLILPAGDEWSRKIRAAVKSRDGDPVPLFVGKISGNRTGTADKELGFLQIDRDWVAIHKEEGNRWLMSHVDTMKQGTWDGGSDMLIAAVKYLVGNADDLVPVAVGCRWSSIVALDPGVEGVSRVASAVRVSDKELPLLHVSASGGDRLWAWQKDGGFKDVTVPRGLKAKSRLTAWGDFDGDGRLDLASWDGAALVFLHQTGEGRFDGPVRTTVTLDGGLLSLAALDVGAEAQAGLLAATVAGPFLIKPRGGEWVAEKLGVPAEILGTLGVASPCLVADFDGDGWVDILQPFEKGGLAFRGSGLGRFAGPARIDVSTGKGPAWSVTGDYDMNGLLDIFVAGPGGCRLWNNNGNLSFRDVSEHTGELSYTVPSGGVSVQTIDINNDGLQDVFLAVETGHPHVYFNRGFRSFGKALSTVWENPEFIAETQDGQQSAVMADFDGNGTQDMALVLKDGTVKVAWLDVPDGQDEVPLQAWVVLPAEAGSAGPAMVTGWSNRRCLGSWNVVSGSLGAHIGLREAGEVRMKWRLPGGGTMEKKMQIEQGCKTVFIKKGG